MAELTIIFDNPESYETNCFGEDTEIDWYRFYQVKHYPDAADLIIKGALHYTAPSGFGDSSSLTVDGFDIGSELSYASPGEMLAALQSDEIAERIVFSVLPEIVASQKMLRELRAKRTTG